MDRFIGITELIGKRGFFNLKSNMDRFIENLFAPHDIEIINLKSNMDRFIVQS